MRLVDATKRKRGKTVGAGVLHQAWGGARHVCTSRQVFVLWDSEDHANTAAGVIRPKLDEHFSGNVQGPPEARLFEVISK